MKRHSFIKFCVFMIVAAMMLSLFAACDNNTEPTEAPTGAPTEAPTAAPTQAPTSEPTQAPTSEPTQAPTSEPTQAPTSEPTTAPTEQPTAAPTEQPTTAPTEQPTAAPTEQPTAAPTEQPTQAPTEQPTQAPTEQPTQAPTEAPTQAPTEAPTQAPTEEPTEPLPVEEYEIKDNYSYILSMTQGDLEDKVLYLDGNAEGNALTTVEDKTDAVVLRSQATEGGFFLFYYNAETKALKYLTLTEVTEGETTTVVAAYTDEAVTVWSYNEELKTAVATLGEKTYYLGAVQGSNGEAMVACDTQGADGYKATLRVPEKCVHYNAAKGDEGHYNIACARCEKGEGKLKDHYFILHTTAGDVIVDACTVCGYVIPIPDSVQLLLNDTMIVGTKTANFQFTISAGEDEDGTKYNRFGGSEKSATHAAQSIWVGKSWGGDRINAGNAKYLAIKMRGTGDLAANTFRFYLGASGNTEALGGLGIRFDLSAMITEGEWTWIVIDLEKALVREDGTDVWVADAEGNYMIDHMYFHTEPHAVDCYYDFATMAFVSDWSGVEYVLDGATEYEYVTGGTNTVTNSSSVTNYNGAYLNTNAVVPKYKLNNTVTEEGFLRWDPDSDVGQWILTRSANPNYKVLSDNVKYFVIKVRKDSAEAKIGKDSFNISLGTCGGGRDPEVAIAPYIDTEFKTFVIDLATVRAFLTAVPEDSADYADYVGKIVLRQLQVTMYGTDAQFDVEFMGFVDDLSAVSAIAGTDKVYYTAEDEANATLEPVAINAKDGSEWVEPAVVLGPDFFTTHSPVVNWKLTPALSEDGSFVRYTGAGIASEQALIQVGRDGSWNKTINVATAKFLVIKARSSKAGLDFRIHLGTGNGVDAASGQKTLVMNLDTEYVTYVVNLEELHPDWSATGGSYIIDKFSVCFGAVKAAELYTAEDYADIEYIAFATTWAQVDEIVDEASVKYALDLGSSSAGTAMATRDQETAVDPTATPIPTNVKVNAGSYGTLWQGTLTSQKEGDLSFHRFTVTKSDSTCQLIYRDPWRQGAATSSPSPIDAKTGELFVITLRTSEIAAPTEEGETATTMNVRFSTAATDLSYKEDGSILADKTVTVTIVTATTSEWTTIVIDLKTLCADVWLANEDGTYKVDDLTIQTFGAKEGEYLDIAYMGFVETWEGVDYVVDAESVYEITAVDGTGANVVVADKVAAEQAPEGDNTEGDTTEGGTTEGDTTEGGTTEGDTTEGDTTEGDTPEGDTTEGDTTEGDTPEA